MKFFAVLAVAFVAALSPALAQQNPDDQYVIIYSLIQQGDTFANSGQLQQALGDYVEAQTELQKFQKVFSDWYPNVVNYRLKYLADKIAAITAQFQSTNAPAATNAPASAAGDLQSQINSLSAQIRQLQTDNETLQAKLKEALSAQPATVSPDEFAKVQEQVRALAKENDLLKATLAQTGTNAVPQNNSQWQQALAAQTARANQLASENQSLQARVQSLTAGADAAEALREENALLKEELANLNPVGTGASDLAQARAQIARWQSEATVNWLEKTALENRIKQMQEAEVSSAPVEAAPDQSELKMRIRELTLERDDLLAELGEANKKLYGRKKQDAAAQIDFLAQQVETLRARVAVDEAQAVPYTPEELALFKPEPLAANPNAEKKSIHELPGGAAMLVAEAENYFTNRQYDKAAADYQEILKRDAKNPFALANLAEIELEENKVADADKHIQAALAQNPNDAYNLTVLGRAKFIEEKYDDALDALSRAAKLDPQNPQIENFLGIVLAQKGLRAQAETAFRMAVQLDPNYADAHKNLAIVLLSAQPPLVELARWHYEKALAAGLPPNPDLEKMLDEKSAANPKQ